jgi:integrase
MADRDAEEVKRGVHTPENASITVAEAADIWIEKGELEKLARSALRQYRNHVDRHIKPSRIGTEKLARLSTPVVEAFRDDLLKRCARPMARKVLVSLKSILSEAQRVGSGPIPPPRSRSMRNGVRKAS